MSYNPKNPRPISMIQPLLHSNYSPKSRYSMTFPADSPYTKQEFKDECDINWLMHQYQTTGELPNLNPMSPDYIDLTGEDFQESMNIITSAQSLFNELPSQLRNRFKNDPGEFLDFMSNPSNRDEMVSLGLVRPLEPVTAPLSAVVPPEAPFTGQNDPSKSA